MIIKSFQFFNFSIFQFFVLNLDECHKLSLISEYFKCTLAESINIVYSVVDKSSAYSAKGPRFRRQEFINITCIVCSVNLRK